MFVKKLTTFEMCLGNSHYFNRGDTSGTLALTNSKRGLEMNGTLACFGFIPVRLADSGSADSKVTTGDIKASQRQHNIKQRYKNIQRQPLDV